MFFFKINFPSEDEDYQHKIKIPIENLKIDDMGISDSV